MIRAAVLACLCALSAVVPARAAGDPAAVAAIEPFLRDDEKAMLAAVLADKAAAAEFNADVKLAAGDAKIIKLILDKWRGRIVAYAEADSRIATPDLEGTYKNSNAMMRPQTRAYLMRRLKTMKPDDRNSLIEYLSAVDSALAENAGKLTWYTKKVVSGIFDKYREDLASYLPEPLAQNAKASAPAAAAALAERRKAAEQPVVAVPPATKQPTVKAPVMKDPAGKKQPPVASGDKKPSVVVSTSTAALDQARDAAEAAELAGGNFDGNVAPPADGSVAADNGAGQPPLSASTPGSKPSLTADVPAPDSSDETFMDDLKKMKTGPGKKKLIEYLPAAGGGLLGGLLGALVGFLLGGPVGLGIGIGVGLVGGAIAGDLIGRTYLK